MSTKNVWNWSLDIENLAVLKFDHDCLMNVGVTKEYVE